MPFIRPERIPQTGHPRIDAGHRELALAVNTLYLAWQTQDAYAELLVKARRALRVIGRHFAEEEAIGREAAYPGLAEHAALYESLLAELTQRVEDLGSADDFHRDRMLDLFSTIETLIYEHEIMDDQDYWILFGQSSEHYHSEIKPFRWDPDLVIGLSDVDEQHQELMAYVNRLLALIRAQAPDVDVVDAFEALFQHTKMHFSWEEDYMERTERPDREAHSMLHDDLLSALQDVQEKVKVEGYLGLESVVQDYLQYWLIDHINHVDRQLVEAASPIKAAG